MKKQALALTTALVVGTLAAPASAFIQAKSEIYKRVDITWNETVDIEKDIVVDVVAVVDGEGAAEASAYTNHLNIFNEVNLEIDGIWNTDRDVLISDSINRNSGVLGVNQDAGDMNNQANVVALAYTDMAGGFAHAQGGTEQINHLNITEPTEEFQPQNPNPLTQLLSSINDNSGIVGVNQNSGHMNNQSNSAAVAAAEDPIVVLSNADLGQVNAANILTANGTVKRNDINNSINRNSGIVQVNQSGGHMNNQASAISIAAGVDSARISNAVDGL